MQMKKFGEKFSVYMHLSSGGKPETARAHTHTHTQAAFLTEDGDWL